MPNKKDVPWVEVDLHKLPDRREQVEVEGYPAYGASTYVWRDGDELVLIPVIDPNKIMIHTDLADVDEIPTAEETVLFEVRSEMAVEVAAVPSSYFAELLVPPDKAADFVLNLEEVHWSRWVSKYGRKRATVLWYAQIWQFVFRHWLAVALDVIKLVPKT